MPRSPLPNPTRSFVIAHRAGNHPDTLRSAADQGAPLIEADVNWFHGRVVVRHIKSVGPLPLYWDKWVIAHPFTKFPRLEDLLECLPQNAELMLDFKGRSHKLAAGVRAALVERPLIQQVTVCARAWHLLDAFRDLDHVRCVRSVGSRRGLRRFLATAPTMAAGTGISTHRRLLSEAVVAQLTEVSDLVMTWPVNDVHVAHELEAWGVHGLISDVPDQLLAAVAADSARRQVVSA